VLFQVDAVIKLAGESENVSSGFAMLKGIWISLFNGYSSDSGNEFLDALLSKGGMSSTCSARAA
jgi:NhaC family Na+:H+ antiporter